MTYINCQMLELVHFCGAGEVYIYIFFVHFQQLTVENLTHYDKLVGVFHQWTKFVQIQQCEFGQMN